MPKQIAAYCCSHCSKLVDVEMEHVKLETFIANVVQEKDATDYQKKTTGTANETDHAFCSVACLTYFVADKLKRKGNHD